MGLGIQRHVSAVLPPGNTQYSLCRRLGGPPGPSGRVRKISPPPYSFPVPSSSWRVARPTELSRPTLSMITHCICIVEVLGSNLCCSSQVIPWVCLVSWMVPLNTRKPQSRVSVLVGCSAVSGERFRTFESFACFSSWDCLLLKVTATRSFETSRTTHPALERHIAKWFPNIASHAQPSPSKSSRRISGL
jgi:hypothetical protein